MKALMLTVLLAIASTPALAIEPGKEGNLAEFVRPVPGERVCYARDYNAAHLAKHPKQTVAAIEFRLTYFKHEPDVHYAQGQRNYYYHLAVRFRDRPGKTFTTGGDCHPGNGSITCTVECDGGGVRVRWNKKPEQILIDLEATGYIRLMSCGGEEEDNEKEYERAALKPGADDKLFLLTRTKREECPAYETW